MKKSNYSGFFRLSVEERLKEVAEFANLTEDEQKMMIDTNIKILFPLMMAKANAAAIFNRAALPKVLSGSLLCRNISHRDYPAPVQGRPAFPALAFAPVLLCGQM